MQECPPENIGSPNYHQENYDGEKMLSITKDTLKALLSGWADLFWISVGSIFFSILASIILTSALESSSASDGEKQILFFATSVGASLFFLAMFLFMQPQLSFCSRSKARSFRVACTVGLLLIGSKWVIGLFFDDNDLYSSLKGDLLIVILVCFIAPVVEEGFFRGLAWATLLKRSISELGTLSATSLLFVIAHFPSDINSLLQLIGMALALGLMRYFSGSIWVGVVFHIIMNVIVFFEL